MNWNASFKLRQSAAIRHATHQSLFRSQTNVSPNSRLYTSNDHDNRAYERQPRFRDTGSAPACFGGSVECNITTASPGELSRAAAYLSVAEQARVLCLSARAGGRNTHCVRCTVHSVRATITRVVVTACRAGPGRAPKLRAACVRYAQRAPTQWTASKDKK